MPLPNDLESLKSIINSQILELQSKDDQLQSKDDQLQSKDRVIENRDQEIDLLQEALRLARMQRFASQSEVYTGSQSDLFDEAEEVIDNPNNDIVELELITVEAHKKSKPKRRPLPEHLPREEVVIELSDTDKICAEDGSVLKEIGEVVSEQIDIVPQKIKVIRTIRKKYACPCCEGSVKTAKLPEKILPKSNATPGLLSYIAVSKYVDALPLYRLEQVLKRSDIEIPRNTMALWLIKLSEKLQSVYNMMQEDLLNSDYVCCDETKVQVLKESGKKAQNLSYMWVRTRHGPTENPIVLFDYDPSRSKEVPKKLLQDFKGHLQVDGYGGYDEVCKSSDVIRVACMAHIRRKFFEAHKASKKKGGAANKVLNLIQGLYKIEKAIKELSIEDRKTQRQKDSLPIMREIKLFLETNDGKYPPKSLMGKAISYAQNQWPHMLNYLEDGKIAIDNNFTENRIRPFAIGRKNWLFSDSVAGAKSSAMLYSIIQTARGNGLEPYSYMKHLLTELPLCQDVIQIENLLPHRIDSKILN